MAGALLQLVAYGAQDLYLTGQPQITFFKVVYRRYTNFAIESIEQTYSGAVGWGNTITVPISRSGDLLSKIYLEIDMNMNVNVLCHRLGFQLIDYVEVEIGGQVIDKHYGHWMDLWAQASCTADEFTKLDRMISGVLVNNTTPAGSRLYVPLQFWFCENPGLALPLIALQYHEVKLNIVFRQNVVLNQGVVTFGTSGAPTGVTETSFVSSATRRVSAVSAGNLVAADATARNYTHAFIGVAADGNYSTVPIGMNMGTIVVGAGGVISSIGDVTAAAGIAADTTTIVVTFTDADGGADRTVDLTVAALAMNSVRVWCDYIFLDTDERRRFAQMSHEYLIRQIQRANPTTINADTGNNGIELRFNHPCSALYVAAQVDGVGTTRHWYDNWFNATGGPQDSITTMLLSFNGSDRFKIRDSSYFRTVQAQCVPGFFNQNTSRNTTAGAPPRPTGGIYMYSFALKPVEHQPSGTSNFSRIDSAVLLATVRTDFTGTIVVYATNYNILRIVSGMGGLAYSN